MGDCCLFHHMRGGLVAFCLCGSLGAEANSSILLCLPGRACHSVSGGSGLYTLLGCCLAGGAACSQGCLSVNGWGKYCCLSNENLLSFLFSLSELLVVCPLVSRIFVCSQVQGSLVGK